MSLWRKKKVAIVWEVLRKNSAPRLAVLLPALDPPTAGAISSPQGLHLIPLPFADDLRDPPPYDSREGYQREDLANLMVPVIRKLSMPNGYQPNRYPNVSLNWFSKVIQAVALDEDLPELPEDKTLPKFKSINTVSL